MNDMTDSPICERAPDLMAFLYHEMNEGETREFELHLQQCGSCREELASFGVVRESIAEWRDEALAGFVATPHVAKKSAFAALRQFFDLSPLWLKAATGFAVIAFCVLAAALFVNQPDNNAVYTQQDVDRLVKEALASQPKPLVEKAPEAIVAVVEPPRPKASKKQVTKDRRPLSRAEREQLAADLRLLSSDDDLDLLSDRINQF
ncbi:MAG TPA: zf-HC2 domain-containing protein [Pyrinomonadaceae bacterium]|nr:zf-HC2 domain-containing protein [Pyrinomonadaceae bacterium]